MGNEWKSLGWNPVYDAEINKYETYTSMTGEKQTVSSLRGDEVREQMARRNI